MIISLGIWDEEDKIAIDSDITCFLYTDMPTTRLSKNKDGASKDEADL